MYRWYVINTYSGHEKKVKQNLEHRVQSLNQQRAVRQVVVPTETAEARPDRRDGRERARFITFLGHCVDELKRVQWPNRSQTFQGTAVTLGFVVLAGG